MRRDVAMNAFTGAPPTVEVYHHGTWYTGELLGWRLESGRCLGRVRVVVGKLRHSAWVDFAGLRLPGWDMAPGDVPEPVVAPVDRPAAAPSAPPVGHGLDDDTRPHALLPPQARRPRPVVRPLPPPRSYGQQAHGAACPEPPAGEPERRERSTRFRRAAALAGRSPRA